MSIKKTPAILFLSIVFVLNLIHLNKVPIAWIDEIMLLDPAWNFIDKGLFAGPMWPHKGAESVFLAYLPLSSFIHVIDLSIFPAEIFYTRLPWLIAYILLCYFLYQYLAARYLLLPNAILLVLCLFVCDEAINHSLRNGRVEMPSMAIIAALFYLNIRSIRPSIQAVLISLLLISHPGLYPIALIFALNLLTKKASILKRFQYIVSITIFPLIYLYLANFDFNAIYQQLILHGKEHDETAITGNLFQHHFIDRFLPVYKYQPWMLAFHIASYAYCIYSIMLRWNPRTQILEWAFLLTATFWFFNLAPFNRYTSVLSLMMFMMLPGFLQRVLSLFGFLRINLQSLRAWQIALYLVFLSIAAAPFIIRHFTVAQQWEARNEYKVYDWLDKEIAPKANEKILIIDEAIGFYYAMKYENIDFTLPYTLDKYSTENYDRVYYLSFREAPKLAIKQHEYLVNDDLKFKLSNQKIYTYNHLTLYQVNNEEALRELKRK
jgi:hypothetical protein